ncbi:efflux RND transporter periplasmic adaptor subunit [Flexithrix dorotheae]|uniref:efflux RND transporter periplasmic adaptor subunit n=1 Tax=Flexithrix dorotheae TaxID=70993 RepID=UPI00036FFB43|nr:efflux RND transporter periplasmic adaptor subunit [Flexithrix dorotheae]
MNNLKSLSIIILIGLVGYACNQNYNARYASQNEEKIKPVLVEELTVSTAPIAIEASGILGSQAEVKMSFKIGGIINRILVNEGQSVKSGQLLATLNTAEIDAQVNQAKNAVEKAKRDLSRAENLHRDSVITLEQLQDLTTLYEVAKSDLQIANFNQKYARIVAPEKGKIHKKFAEEGELVNGGSPIFQFGNTAKDAYVMRIGVADKDIVRLQLGDSAKITFDAYPSNDFPAYVTEIAESADPKTGTFEVELTLQPTEHMLKNGFVGKVEIYPATKNSYYKISINALVEGNEETAQIYVLKEKSNRVKKVQVKPEHIVDGFFTVRADTSMNGKVVVEGAAYLSDGDQVEIIN